MESDSEVFISFYYAGDRITEWLVAFKNSIFPNSLPTTPNGSAFFNTLGDIGSWMITILTISIVLLIVWGIYTRIRIFEIDQVLDRSYKGHFIKPETVMKRVNARWDTILAHFASQNPNDWRAAILDADTMLDELVTSLGYTGESLGEKLTSIRVQDFPTLQAAWEAHKVRNIIAHEGANYNLSERQKELTRKNFEAVFRDSGVI